jgi:hypothetical protein
MRRLLAFSCALLLAGIFCLSQQEHVGAFWQSRDSNYNIAISGGGATQPAIDGTPTFANSSATISFPTTSNATDVCLLVETDNGAYPTSVTDNTGHTGNSGTWTQQGGIISPHITLWYNTTTAAISSGSTITTNAASSVQHQAFCLSGANTSSIFDPLTGGTGTGYVTNATDPISITPTLSADFVFAGFRLASGSSSTAGSCCSLIISQANQFYAVSEYVPPTASATTYGMNLGSDSGDANGAIAVAVKHQ